MGRTILLDPGHGGRDPGAVGPNNRLEKDDNLRFALALRPRLQQQGFSVMMSRTTDVFITIDDRVRMANTQNVDTFLSIHRNGFHDPQAHGAEMVVGPSATPTEMALATTLLDEVRLVGAHRIRGIPRKNKGVLRDTRMPAVMTEIGFVTNAEDNRLFDLHFDAHIEAITRGLCIFHGVPYSPPGATEPLPPRQLARIQLGAFTWPGNEAGARGALAAIQAIPGLEDAWLVIPDTEPED